MQMDAVTLLCIFVDPLSNYKGFGRLRGLRRVVLARFWSARAHEMDAQLRFEEENVVELFIEQFGGDIQVITRGDTSDLGKDCEALAF